MEKFLSIFKRLFLFIGFTVGRFGCLRERASSIRPFFKSVVKLQPEITLPVISYRSNRWLRMLLAKASMPLGHLPVLVKASLQYACI